MIKKYFRQFVECHQGTLNKIIHIVGFTIIGVEIIEKSLLFVIIGGITQELGHFYQYFKTKESKRKPFILFKTAVSICVSIIYTNHSLVLLAK